MRFFSHVFYYKKSWFSVSTLYISNPQLQHAVISQVTPDSAKRPRRRWSHRMGSLELMVKSMLDLRQLETFAHKKNSNSPPHDRERQSTSSLQEPMVCTDVKDD